MNITLNDVENCFFQKLKSFRKITKIMDIYVVGGWVRDKLLGKDSLDIDIVCPKEQIGLLVMSLQNIGDQFGIITPGLTLEQIQNQENIIYINHSSQVIKQEPLKEYRKENYTLKFKVDLREIFQESLIKDAEARDFTINAIFYNIFKEEIQDVCNGLEDLKNKKLSLVSDPDYVFKNSYSRFLRLLRFKWNMNYEIDDQILEYLNQQNFHELGQTVSLEDYTFINDLKKCTSHQYSYQILKDIQTYNIHRLYQFQLTDDEMDSCWQKYVEILDKIQFLFTDQKIQNFVKEYLLNANKTIERFIIELKTKSLPFVYYFEDQQEQSIIYQSMQMHHSRENQKVIREDDLIERYYNQRPEQFESFEQILEEILDLIDLKGRKLIYTLLYCLYYIEKDQLENFSKYFIENIEEKYFKYWFQVLELDSDNEQQFHKQFLHINQQQNFENFYYFQNFLHLTMQVSYFNFHLILQLQDKIHFLKNLNQKFFPYKHHLQKNLIIHLLHQIQQILNHPFVINQQSFYYYYFILMFLILNNHLKILQILFLLQKKLFYYLYLKFILIHFHQLFLQDK